MSEAIDMTRLQSEAARLVETALKAGADACDVVVARGQSLGVEVRDGKVENTERSEADNFSLRVFCGNKIATVGANNADDGRQLAERAVAMAKVSPEDPYQGLAPAELLAKDWPDLDLLDQTGTDAATLEARALACEEAGRAIDGVSKSMGGSAGWGMTGFVLATSTGFSGNYGVSRFSTSAAMVAGEGTAMERDFDFDTAVHQSDLKDPTEIGRTAGERVVRRLNPQQAASASVPIIFDKRVATSLLGALMGAINGASVARKTSFLRDEMGKKVANSAITIVDDPLRPRGLGSRPFDGEGMATAPFHFIEDGVLRDWVLDWAAARELGLKSNGHAARGGAGTAPSTSNCHIEAGETSVEDMIAGIKSGLLLTETIGHGVNMVTGDFSKGAAGFWIENGEVTWPVSEITIAGNLKDMFLQMIPASDLEMRRATNSPSLLVEGMTIGGK